MTMEEARNVFLLYCFEAMKNNFRLGFDVPFGIILWYVDLLLGNDRETNN
jgi:hypothetical protein